MEQALTNRQRLFCFLHADSHVLALVPARARLLTFPMICYLALPNLLRWAILVEGGMILAAVVIGRVVGVDPLESIVSSSIRMNLISCGGGLAAGSLLFAAGIGLSLLPWPAMRRFNAFMQQQVTPLFVDSHWLELAFISALAGLGEELLFRGLIQAGLAEAWTQGLGLSSGWLWGMILASLLFGICHAMNWTYFILATVMGFFFAGLLLAFDNLWVCIVAHGWYDFLMLLYLVQRMRKTASNGVDEQ